MTATYCQFVAGIDKRQYGNTRYEISDTRYQSELLVQTPIHVNLQLGHTIKFGMVWWYGTWYGMKI